MKKVVSLLCISILTIVILVSCANGTNKKISVGIEKNQTENKKLKKEMEQPEEKLVVNEAEENRAVCFRA